MIEKEGLLFIEPGEVRNKINKGETFIVNVVTDWCPDCTQRQRPCFSEFVNKMNLYHIPVFQLTVQYERLVFLSDEHENLTNDFGGHGYPRTVLIVNGEIQADSRVEVVTPEALDAMADDFIKRISR